MEIFNVSRLPEIDQREIKRGLCPWCLVNLVEVNDEDACPKCGDIFIGKITIED